MSVGQFEVVSKATPSTGQYLGQVAFFNEDGAPIDVDVPLATAAELSAGTVTQPRMVTPKLIHDEIARQIAAAAA